MTDEELSKVYIKREVCAHCRFPQFCKGKGEKYCSDIAIIKRHYLAGVEAGKSQAETDLATVAYMQGAESGYNKAFVEADKNLKAIVTDFNKANEWHYVKDGEHPTHSNRVLVFTDEGVGFGIYGLDNKKWYTYDTGFDVIAWKEITLPALPKEIEE